MGVIYALVASGFLAIGCYAMYQRSEAAGARADSAEALVGQYKQDLAESEADKTLLKDRGKKTDATVVARDKRIAKLEADNHATKDELDRLKESLPKEDQDCLDRALPPALADRLRNDGTNKDKERPANGAIGAPVAVPEVSTPR